MGLGRTTREALSLATQKDEDEAHRRNDEIKEVESEIQTVSNQLGDLMTVRDKLMGLR